MPFQSIAQQKWMFANKPEMARKWAAETPDFKSLPKKKKKKQEGGFSTTGYLPNSKDKDKAFNVIPSPNITMKTVPYPVLGISKETGEQKLMMPEEEHHFENTQNVIEIPMKKEGGLIDLTQFKKGGFKLNPENKGDCTPMTKSTCTGKKRQFAINAKKHFKKHEEGGLIFQEGGRLVTEVPQGYNFLREDGGKKFYNKKSQQALAMAQATGQARGGAEYDKFLQEKLRSGVSPDELVSKKYIDASAVGKYQQYYNPTEDIVYTQPAPTKPVPLTSPAYAGRGQAIYTPDKHIAGEIYYNTRDSKSSTDGGTVNTAKSAAHIKFRNDHGYDGTEVDVDGPELQKYLGTTHTFPTGDAYNELRKRGTTAKFQVGGYQTVPSMRPDTTIGQASVTGLHNPLQLQPAQPKPREDQDLSFLPAVANSVAEALATRVDMQRKNNIIQGNLANPFNFIPETNNTNKYVNYGTPQFQDGGEVGDDEEYEDRQDEEFIFDQPAVTQEVVPEAAAPEPEATPLEEETSISLDTSSTDENESEEDETDETYASSPELANRLKSMVLNKNTGGLDNEIAAVESGGDYRAQNPNSSAVGKYQFLWNQWKGDIAKATGITSKEQFRNNPEAQEKFYAQYKQSVLLPSAASLQKYNNKGLNFNQLAKLVHFKGVGGAKKYLTQGIDDTKANNISIPKYIGK